MVGTPGHDAAKTYLLKRMEGLLEPYHGAAFELPYSSDGVAFANLVGVMPGAGTARKPVLLGAHYDTAGPLPGADDNAAAVAILLAVAERLRVENLQRPVIVAFFDAEEPPYFHAPTMGSTHFYRHQCQEEIHAAVILDLVGHDVPIPNLEDVVAVTGMESAPQFPELLKSVDERISGVRTLAVLNSYVGDMSDHHVFRLGGCPYLFFSCGRWEHYHSPTDTPERLNYTKMEAFLGYLTALVLELCATSTLGPFGSYDSTEDEIYFLRKHLGETLEGFGVSLQGRQDITNIVRMLMGTFSL